MNNKKAVILTAVISVCALRNHPYKQQFLICDSFYPLNNGAADIFAKMMSSSTANPENYLVSFVHRKVFEIADKFYDMLLKVAVNDTIYPLASMSTDQFC